MLRENVEKHKCGNLAREKRRKRDMARQRFSDVRRRSFKSFDPRRVQDLHICQHRIRDHELMCPSETWSKKILSVASFLCNGFKRDRLKTISRLLSSLFPDREAKILLLWS